MADDYSSFCDDFYVNFRIGSNLNMPAQRDTVLFFFDQIRRAFPDMTRFRRAEGPDYLLEEDRRGGRYRWVNLEPNQLTSGMVNPAGVEEAMKLHRHVAELVPHGLSISPLELAYVDLLYSFDLDYRGSHDEVVAEALYADSPMACLLEMPGARAIEFAPIVTVSLSDDLRVQGRIEVITRSDHAAGKTSGYGEEPISVYVVVRRYMDDSPRTPLPEMLSMLQGHVAQLADEQVLPSVVRRLREAIASRS
jgi:hypothetical protein